MAGLVSKVMRIASMTFRKTLVLIAALVIVRDVCAQTQLGGSASVAGVLEGDRGKNATVHLTPTVLDPFWYYDGYEAIPKSDGTFAFTEIPPGQYRLTVDNEPKTPMVPPGYSVSMAPRGDRGGEHPSGITVAFPGDMPAGVVRLSAGEHRNGVVLGLTHRLSICGRVTKDMAPQDAWGRDIGPAQMGPVDTSVIYLRYNPEFGVLENATSFGTDKDGSFRIMDVAPGTYYLKVGVGTEIWYPGTETFAMAQPIVVGDSAAASCENDIAIPNHTGYLGAVATVAVEGGEDGQRYKVAFQERNAEGVSHFGLFATLFQDKAIGPGTTPGEVHQAAGTYEAVLYDEGHVEKNVWGDAPTQRVIFDSQVVTLQPAIQSGAETLITFRPHAMASLEGDVRLEKITRDDFCPNCQSIFVSILRDGDGEFQTATLSKGNHFDFHNVTPGDYQLFVYTTRPDTVFLKSIVTNGQASQGRRFTIAEAKFASMEVTLSGDMARAAGHVSPDARHAVHWETEGMRPRGLVSGKVIGEEGAVYTVRLLPLVFNDSDSGFETTTGADGSFRFDGVPPGIYEVRGRDTDDVRFDYGAPKVDERGTPLLVRAGAKIDDVMLHAPHRSSICGHITVTMDTTMSGRRIWYRTARESYGSQLLEVQSDTQGYFRIDRLLAGDYYLATPGRYGGDPTLGIFGADHLSAYKAIHVDDGKDTGCGSEGPLELHVTEPEGHATVGGTVTGELPARLGDRFEVELSVGEKLGPFPPWTRNVDLEDDRSFRFDSVPQGQHQIRVYGVFGKKPSGTGVMTLHAFFQPLRHLVAMQTVTVGDKDLTNLALASLSLPSINGAVTLPSPAAPYTNVKVSDVTVALVPQRVNATSTAVLKEVAKGQATFDIGAIDPGAYDLRIQPTQGYPVNSLYYVQSVTLDGKRVDPMLVEIAGTGAKSLQVELGTEMASVQPSVGAETAFAAPAVPLAEWCNRANYTILLFPAALLDAEAVPQEFPNFESGWKTGTSVGDVCKGVRSWAGGVFNRSLDKLTPGKYYVLAVQTGTRFDFGYPGQKAYEDHRQRLLTELAKIATPVTLHAGETLEVHLEDKTLEASRVFALVGVEDEPEDQRTRGGRGCCRQ
jgi:hypothetical protein